MFLGISRELHAWYIPLYFFYTIISCILSRCHIGTRHHLPQITIALLLGLKDPIVNDLLQAMRVDTEPEENGLWVMDLHRLISIDDQIAQLHSHKMDLQAINFFSGITCI